MKKYFLILALLTTSLQAQEIQWMSLPEALEAQKTNPKKIFMDVYTHWCGPCKLLDKNVSRFSNVTVVKKGAYNRNIKSKIYLITNLCRLFILLTGKIRIKNKLIKTKDT